MKNLLWYLGFLSLLGFLGFKHSGFFGFFGFIGYFSIYKDNDERLESIVGQGTKFAFLWTVFFGAFSLLYLVISGNEEFLKLAFVLLFGGALLICLLTCYWYNFLKK